MLTKINKVKLSLFCFVFTNIFHTKVNATTDIPKQDIIFSALLPILSGALLSKAYTSLFTTEKQTGKDNKNFCAKLYSKILSEGAMFSIVKGLYEDTAVDLYEKKYGEIYLKKTGDELFGEIFWLTLGFNKIIKSFQTAKEALSEKSKSFISFLFSIGIMKALLENEIKKQVKNKTKNSEFAQNHPYLTSLSSEILKLAINEYLVTPTYHLALGFLTLCYSKKFSEKQKMSEGIRDGLRYKSLDEFSDKVKESDMFSIAEGGFNFAKLGISSYKIASILAKYF